MERKVGGQKETAQSHFSNAVFLKGKQRHKTRYQANPIASLTDTFYLTVFIQNIPCISFQKKNHFRLMSIKLKNSTRIVKIEYILLNIHSYSN